MMVPRIMETARHETEEEEEEGNDVSTILSYLIHETARKREYYDRLIESERDTGFQKIAMKFTSSLRVQARAVSIPSDYVIIDVYDNAELGQIALHDGLLIFTVEKTEDDVKIRIYYAIDTAKKMVYMNTSKVTA